MSSVGLPEDHVPSMKELSENGRKDLANMVRRRGYKLITELLCSSLKHDSEIEKHSIDDQSSNNGCSDEASEVQNEILLDSAESVTSSSGDSVMKKYLVGTNGAVASGTSLQIFKPSESSIRSFHSKAANFVQTGKLDVLEEAPDIERGEHTDSEHKFGSRSSDDGHDINHSAYADSLEAPFLTRQTNRDEAISNRELKGVDNDGNSTSGETNERIDHAKINSLKSLLHQKEMELLELKRQIERDKQSLSILQDKANEEIDNAHRMVTEKEMELRAAEESLSGLKEVQIEYRGNAETVEVAGSFNGWHNQIKMDLQPSSEAVDGSSPRGLKHWSTILWLYPGIYEIKFIVDGTWRTDPHREISTSWNITNNVLRVGK